MQKRGSVVAILLDSFNGLVKLLAGLSENTSASTIPEFMGISPKIAGPSSDLSLGTIPPYGNLSFSLSLT